jgi:hypothetical protein
VVELVFADGRLVQGDAELARIEVEFDAGAVDARLRTATREYVITRPKRYGWRYQVVDPADEQVVCAFRPFALRRGGNLCAGATSVSLSTRWLNSGAWRFITEDGHRVEASVGPPRGVTEFRDDPSGERRRVTVLRSGDPPVVTLRLEDSISVIPHAAVTLAFGCWLIVQYEGVPVWGLPAGGGS